MKLTFVLEDLLTGGAQTQSVDLILGLRQRGMQAEVLVLGRNVAPRLVERLGGGVTLLDQRGLTRPGEWKRLGAAIRAERPDMVVAVNQIAVCVAAAAARGRGGARPPLAAVFHATGVQGVAGWVRTAPFLAAARTCDALVYVSERSRRTGPGAVSPPSGRL